MNGFELCVKVSLPGLDLRDLVVAELEPELQSFHTAGFRYLPVLFRHFFPAGYLLFLLRCQQGFRFAALVFLQREKAGLVFSKGDIVFFEQVGRLVMVFFINGHQLVALFLRVVDTVAMTTVAEAMLGGVVIAAGLCLGHPAGEQDAGYQQRSFEFLGP